MRRSARVAVVVVAVVAAVGVAIALGLPAGDARAPSAPTASTSSSASGADPIAALFADHRSDVEVQGSGTVVRLLPDDDDGARHQRFILRTASGVTVLVAHNIDIAPRLDGLAVGDPVEFHGEYVWSELGGTVHGTHHDPAGRHEDGWLRWRNGSSG